MRLSMPHNPSRWLASAPAILWLAMSSAGCTSQLPRASLPPVPEVQPVTPAECLRSALLASPDRLTSLPAGFRVSTPDAQARALLKSKTADAGLYLTLRATAIRCAPEK